MRSRFDQGIAPELHFDIAIPHEDGTLAAYYFSSERAPFVVKAQKSGRIQREVCWRDDTGLRTAHRSDLLRMLVPAQRTPTAEVLIAFAAYFQRDEKHFFEAHVELYFEPKAPSPVTMPLHRATFESEELAFLLKPSKSLLVSARPAGSSPSDLQASTVDCRGRSITLHGPAHVALSLKWRTPNFEPTRLVEEFDAKLELPVSGSQSSVTLDLPFSKNLPIEEFVKLPAIGVDIAHQMQDIDPIRRWASRG